MNSADRVEAIQESTLDEYLAQSLRTYQESVEEVDSISNPVSLYIVGSVLTDDFIPGESDIDIIIGTDKDPNSVCEHFWRYWSDTVGSYSEIHTQINFEFTKIDVCGVHSDKKLQEFTPSDPVYELRDPYYRYEL